MTTLRPPHLHVGFFWQRSLEREPFAVLLEWLVQHGHALEGPAVAVRRRGGVVPVVRCVDAPGLPEEDIRVMALREAAGSEWAPVRQELRATREDNVDAVLQYAPAGYESWRAGESSPVELYASGYSVDLCRNAPADLLTHAIVEDAKRTERWIARVLGEVCDSLRPDYAGSFCERSLMAPRSLLQSTDPLDFETIFIAERLCRSKELQEAAGALSGVWSAEPRRSGYVFRLSVAPQDASPGKLEMIKRLFLSLRASADV